MKFTKNELEYMYKTIGDNCSPLYDMGTKKHDLTKSIMRKMIMVRLDIYPTFQNFLSGLERKTPMLNFSIMTME